MDLLTPDFPLFRNGQKASRQHTEEKGAYSPPSVLQVKEPDGFSEKKEKKERKRKSGEGDAPVQRRKKGKDQTATITDFFTGKGRLPVKGEGPDSAEADDSSLSGQSCHFSICGGEEEARLQWGMDCSPCFHHQHHFSTTLYQKHGWSSAPPGGTSIESKKMVGSGFTEVRLVESELSGTSCRWF